MPTLSPLEQQALAEFRAAVEARLGPGRARYTLFGSRARGEGHAGSDLDVLITAPALTPGERRAIIDCAWEVEQRTGRVIAPLAQDADGWRGDVGIAAVIAREGRPL